jgi:hypothetical protein
MMRWAGHVARMGEKRNAYRILQDSASDIQWQREVQISGLCTDQCLLNFFFSDLHMTSVSQLACVLKMEAAGSSEKSVAVKLYDIASQKI